MLRWVIGSSMRARVFVVAVAVAITAVGLWQLRSTHVDSLPEFMPPTVQIQTEALGLSAPEVEQLITVPLEQDLLAGVPWLDTMRSSSIPGLSSIELVFDPGTDLLRARQVVQERLTQAAGLPNVSGPPQMLQPLSSTSRIMMIRFASTDVSQIELSVLARWTIRPKILGVPGVANVSIWGQRERQLQVQVDPDRLRAHHLTLDEVIETSGNALWASPLTFLEASTPGTGGFIDTAQQRLGIQHLQPITTASELGEVPIHTDAGKTLQLRDVAEVVEDHQPLIGDTVFTDGEPGLVLVIEKFPDANTVEVTQGVEDAVAALVPGLGGIDVDTTVYQPATYIERGAHNLDIALLIALLLIASAIFVLLFQWRSAVIAIAAIVASFGVASLVLALTGTTLNTMVIVGLVMALVVVVDDAVGDAQSAAARLRARRMNGVEPHAASVLSETFLAMRSSIAFATLVTIVLLVPLFFIQGESAPFMPTIVWSFGLAAAASMLVALTVTPALSLLLLPTSPVKGRGSPLAAWMTRGYDRALASVTQHPWSAVGGAVALAIAGLLVLPFVTASALPSFRDGNVLIDLQAVPGTSLPEMDRITNRIGAALSSVDGVGDVGAHIGRAITSDQVVGVDAAQLWVSLEPDADYDATLGTIRGVVDGFPGLAHSIRTYSDDRIVRVLSDTASPIVVRVYGQNPETLQQQADLVRDAIAGVDGITDPRVELQAQEPTIDVRVDLEKAERFGVVPGDVRRAAATLMSGIGVGSLFEEQKVFDVVVWGTPQTRSSLGNVRDLLIDTPDGGHVRLGDVADVSVAPTAAVIRHQDLSRSLDITADVEGRSAEDVAADVRSRISGMTFPLEYHAEVVEDNAVRSDATKRAIAVTLAAAIVIFLLLQGALGSWRLALVSFAVLPVAISGSLLAVAVTDRVFSLGTLLGCVATLALGVRLGLCSFRSYQQMQRDTGGELDAALVHRGARERFIPIITTTLAIALGLLPFALSGGAAGQEVVRPMADAIIGGAIAAAALAVSVLPAVYLRFAPVVVPEADVTDEVVIVPELQPLAEA
jgi:Cu/Ag efflux pump CusA